MNGWLSIDCQVGRPEVPKLPNFLLTTVRTVHVFSSPLELPQRSEIFEKAALVITKDCKHTRFGLFWPDLIEKVRVVHFFGFVLEGKLIIIHNRSEEQNVYTSPELTSLQIPSSKELVQFFTLFQIKLNNFICNHADCYFLCGFFSYLIAFIQCS